VLIHTRALLFGERFAEQVARVPAATAVVCGRESLSYAEVDRRSSRLARALREAGVGRDEVVPLYAERGVDMLVGIVGVMKAGGAYLPLDVSYPAARTREILRQAGSRVALVQAGQEDRFGLACGEGLAVAAMALRQEDGGGEAATLERPAPGDLAYVIFTSGSTGVPKGAMIEHAGMANHLDAKVTELDLTARDRIVQNASHCFDISVWQFLTALTVGGQVHIVSDDVARDPRQLFAYVEAHGITVLEVVPSLLNAALSLVDDDPTADSPLATLRWLLLTGESLPPTLCRRWLSRHPSVPIVNAYGPTECSDDVTHAIVSQPPTADAVRVPIGCALPNVALYLVEEGVTPLRRCAPGVAGELCVGGVAVGRGYLNDPTRTARVFQADPFSDQPHARLYRTGDLCRELPDGNLEFLGRIDRQVKVRGFRIELEEIESALRRHPSVADVTVVVRKLDRMSVYFLDNEHSEAPRSGGEERNVLVAYVVERASVTAGELQNELCQTLPAYMVPEQILFLPALPLTPNGKVDAAALPAPRQRRPEEPYDAPVSTLERQLCAIWADLLGIDRVGRSDNFFALGGDSLIAVQILNRIRQVLGIEVTFRELIEEPTVTALTTLVEGKQPRALDRIPPAAVGDFTGATFPLSWGQQGLWFLWKIAPDNPYYAFQGILTLYGSVDLQALQSALRKVVERHAVLRTKFVERDGLPEQLICPVPTGDYPVIDLRDLEASERPTALRSAARTEVTRAFDLQNETMFRVHVYRMAPDETAVVLTMHEIVLDAWATCVLVRELSTLYEAALRGALDEVAAPPLQFHDYAAWEKTVATRQKMAAEAEYWRGKLSGAVPLLELPIDRPRPTHPTFRGSSIGTVLDPALSKRLKQLTTDQNATLFMVLLAAYNVLLQGYSGQDDIVVGAPNANRDHDDTESLSGYFISMLPMRTEVSGDPTLREVLRRTRDTVSGALNNARYPFIWIVEDLKCARDTSYSPVFQVMFDMLNFPKIPVEARGIEMKFDELDVGYKKYDLELYAHEQGDRIYVRLSYLIELFDRETVDRMLANYVHILEQMTEDLDRKVSGLDLVCEAERRLLLHDLHRTRLDYDQRSVTALFDEQAVRTREATAFVVRGTRVSYGAVADRANRLARYLVKSGLGRNSRVGLSLARGVDEVIAMLAILKTGAAYVPLDPDHPATRLDEIAAEAGCSVLLLSASQAATMAHPAPRLVLEQIQEEVGREPAYPMSVPTEPDDLFTIMSTSSSTGRAKATLIAQRGVRNRLEWMWAEYPFRSGDVTASLRSTALATHFWEIFGGLLKGVPTVLVSRDEVLEPIGLWNTLTRERVSHLTLSPSLLDLILRQAEAHPGTWTALRFAASGGEPLPVRLVERWRASFPGVELVNVYGTTECSASVTSFPTARLSAGATRMPIGTPVVNTRVFALDRMGRLSPLGAVGELFVSGPGVCPGYLNAPESNEDAFVPDRITTTKGARLFRTRDLGRIRPDGVIEVIGRLDHQVKVRGFRVDLGEVEATLRRHPDVDRCACVTYVDGEYHAIAAFYTSAAKVSPETLREYATERLPHYMVAQRFIRLDQIPTTPSGKIAYKALPAPQSIVEERPEPDSGARDAVEQTLVKIWEEILNQRPIGVKDNFFALGGHSLAAAEMSARLQSELGVEVSIATLYQGAATVERLANILRQQGAAA
jgi:surfactin family lipopeptide synthetase A